MSDQSKQWVMVPVEPTREMVKAAFSWSDAPTSCYKAMLAAAPKVEREGIAGWQPIETAPKDGSRFLAFYNGRVEFFHWQESKLFPKDPVGWRDNFINVYREGTGPKHWMPLPAAPSHGERKEDA